MIYADDPGITAARRVASWELGDPSWADIIVRAYLNPEVAIEELEAEMSQ